MKSSRCCLGLACLLALAPLSGSVAADAPKAPHVLFMIGENEYGTKDTLPAFAKADLESRGVKGSFALAPSDESNDFPGLEKLKEADLLFVSVRRRTPSRAHMELVRAHVAAGKPVVGIRTASHAFALRDAKAPLPEGHADWRTFDQDVLGGNYSNHFGKGLPTFAKVFPANAKHPVLTGIPDTEFPLPSHLYKNPDLPAHVTVLMTGRMEGRPGMEPIAWVNTANQRRVFYTSMGSVEDFKLPEFQRLLRNGVLWALDRPVNTPKTPGP